MKKSYVSPEDSWLKFSKQSNLYKEYIYLKEFVFTIEDFL